MTHKDWRSIKEVPYCFSRPSIKFQDHTGQTNLQFYLNWEFPGCNSSSMALKWYTKLAVVKKNTLLLLGVIHQFLKSYLTKNRQFWPQLRVSELQLQLEFTDSFQMIYKSCCSIAKVPDHLLRSCIKFQGHTARKIEDLNPIYVRLVDWSQLSNSSDLPCITLVMLLVTWFVWSIQLSYLCHMGCITKLKIALNT